MSLLEVETKVKLHKNEVSELRERIIKIAKFSKKEKRGDDYFAIKRKGYPHKAFRIRDNGKEYIVNFKKWLKKYWESGIVVKEEFEFRIKDRDSFLALMRDLGFVEWMKKIKTSESYKYKNDERIVIEINKVKHLGYFIEIEYLAKRWEMKKAKKKIFNVLKELGIEQKQIDNIGYTRMLWDKGIKDKRYFINPKKNLQHLCYSKIM